MCCAEPDDPARHARQLSDEAYLQHVIEVLRQTYGPLDFYLNHCTGAQAYLALANAFGDRVNLCPAGTILEFE